MIRKETVSVNIGEISDCIKKKIMEDYPYLKDDKDVLSLDYASKVHFLLFNVVRKCDVVENPDFKLSDDELIKKGFTKDGIVCVRKTPYITKR